MTSRDYPIILGVHPCPVCGEFVSTESMNEEDDPEVVQEGDLYLHATCAESRDAKAS